MGLTALLPLIVCLGVFAVPVLLSRRKISARAHDYFVSSEYTPPTAIQNASIAYALPLTTVAALFAFGASTDAWPAIISAVSFGVGVWLLYTVRVPMLAFLSRALRRDQSITVHEFITKLHGNDARLRVLAASLTVFALAGLTVAVAFALAALLKPVMPDPASPFIIAACVLLVAMVSAIWAGNSGVIRAAQAQLAVIYLGLFVATALLIYLAMSGAPSLPPQATFAILFVAACCIAFMLYRRTRYIDTSPFYTTGSGDADGARTEPGAGAFVRFEKVLNVSVSVFAGFVIAFAYIAVSGNDYLELVHDAAAATLASGTQASWLELVSLGLLPLFYPLADLTNWQRIAAFEKNNPGTDDTTRDTRAYRGLFRIYAIETPLIWLFLCMVGALGAAAAFGEGIGMPEFAERLLQQDNFMSTGAVAFLLVAVFAMAFAMMSSAFSASLCAIRYDILPAVWPELRSETASPAQQAVARRRTVISGILFYVLMLGASALIAGEGGSRLVVAFYCAQLAPAPLILGPAIARARGGYGIVDAKWALAIVAVSAAIGIGAVAAHLASGVDTWLWAAVPATLAAGFVLFAIARFRSVRQSA
ncbi:MAG: hypothetical protein JO230_27090 [Xanthobacteraceae bacterium]|nr:hypothetical protein [Xanthobacteraceae bacterium]